MTKAEIIAYLYSIHAHADYSIEDIANDLAVPIVKCNECNFWDRDHISCEGLAKCLTGESGIRYRSRNDFCSSGKMKG